ncbi:MAG TPA: hypothetical protein VNR89_03980 [Roseomonas sp.]|nr:hypothetical protein [Roseomonas sp.]
MLNHEAGEKLTKVIALSGAIQRARKAVEVDKSAAAAVSLQQLINQRRELMALLPKPRLVGGTDVH